jgi:hypothetical protein
MFFNPSVSAVFPLCSFKYLFTRSEKMHMNQVDRSRVSERGQLVPSPNAVDDNAAILMAVEVENLDDFHHVAIDPVVTDLRVEDITEPLQALPVVRQPVLHRVLSHDDARLYPVEVKPLLKRLAEACLAGS